MKKLKFLLLSLFTPLFLGVSFGSDLFESTSLYSGSISSDQSLSFSLSSFSSFDIICFNVKNFSVNFSSPPSGSIGFSGLPLSPLSLYFQLNSSISTSSNITLCAYYDSNLKFTYSPYSYGGPVGTFDYNIFGLSSGVSPDCSQDSNYLQCLDRVNELNGQVGTLSGSLQTCNSDLATCTNSCDVSVSQCRESLSGCQSDLTNMTNYNDSLNSQLQECLANSPIPDSPCEGTGCDEIISGTNTMFSMFRSVEDMMYSLPLSNNIYLPNGFRGYVDSGVVAIGEIEKKKIYIDDDGFDEINKSYYKVFAGLIFLFLTALFTYYLKKFITKFFIPKS